MVRQVVWIDLRWFLLQFPRYLFNLASSFQKRNLEGESTENFGIRLINKYAKPFEASAVVTAVCDALDSWTIGRCICLDAQCLVTALWKRVQRGPNNIFPWSLPVDNSIILDHNTGNGDPTTDRPLPSDIGPHKHYEVKTFLTIEIPCPPLHRLFWKVMFEPSLIAIQSS